MEARAAAACPDLDFGGLWSLMWQLQVCDFLVKNAESVEFRGNRGGADLACIVNGDRLYVECYAVRQSWSPIEFMKEVLSVHSEDVRIDTPYMVPVNLRHPADAIDHVLTSATNSAVLAAARARAAVEYPAEVARYPAEAQSEAVLIRANVESNTGEYMPSTEFPNAVGEPKFAMQRLAQAAIDAKAKKGQLRDLKPNMLAASLLLGGEAQVGTHMRPGFKPDPNLAGGIEALAVSWVGINAELTKPDLRLRALERSPHPAEQLCGSHASAS